MNWLQPPPSLFHKMGPSMMMPTSVEDNSYNIHYESNYHLWLWILLSKLFLTLQLLQRSIHECSHKQFYPHQHNDLFLGEMECSTSPLFLLELLEMSAARQVLLLNFISSKTMYVLVVLCCMFMMQCFSIIFSFILFHKHHLFVQSICNEAAIQDKKQISCPRTWCNITNILLIGWCKTFPKNIIHRHKT